MSLKPIPARSRPNQPKNLPKTNKTTPKPTKTAHPNRTIPRKTLDINPNSPRRKNFSNSLRHTRACRGSPHALLPFSRTWIHLNQAEQT